jgi:hypothetical protein
MLDWKRKLAIVAVPATLAVGGTLIIAHANAPSSGSAAAAVTLTAATAPSPAAEAPETAAETAAEKAEPNEAALPGGGHADAAGQADHQFEGIE